MNIKREALANGRRAKRGHAAKINGAPRRNGRNEPEMKTRTKMLRRWNRISKVCIFQRFLVWPRMKISPSHSIHFFAYKFFDGIISLLQNKQSRKCYFIYPIWIAHAYLIRKRNNKKEDMTTYTDPRRPSRMKMKRASPSMTKYIYHEQAPRPCGQANVYISHITYSYAQSHLIRSPPGGPLARPRGPPPSPSLWYARTHYIFVLLRWSESVSRPKRKQTMWKKGKIWEVSQNH